MQNGTTALACRPPVPPQPFLTTQNDIRRLLPNEVRRQQREAPRNLGVHASIHDAQALDASDLELGVQHGHGVAVLADGACAGGVVAPGGVLDVVEELLLGLDLGTRGDLFEGVRLVAEGPAGELDGFGDGGEVGGVVA